MHLFTRPKSGEPVSGQERPLRVPHSAPPLLRIDSAALLEGHTDRGWCVSWSPTAQVLASCSGDSTVRIWGPTGANGAWACLHTIKDEHTRTVRHVAWSPSGEYIACASFDRTASVWRRSSDNPNNFEFELEGILDGHESEVKCVAWATDNTLATCSRDRTVWIWDRVDVGEYECAGVLAGHSQDVKSCTWILPSSSSSSNGGDQPLLVSCSYDNTVKVWTESHRRDDWYCAQTITRHEETVWAAAVQSVTQSIETLREPEEEDDANRKKDANTFEPQPLLCCCSDDKSVTFWARDSDGKFRAVAVASGIAERSIYSVSWAPSDASATAAAIVACGSGDNKITLLGLHQSPADREVHVGVVAEMPAAHDADVNSVAFCPFSRIPSMSAVENDAPSTLLLASGGDDNIVRLWNVSLA